MAGLMVLAAAAVPSAQASSAYQQIDLVSDIDGLATFTDPYLVNPWGLVKTPDGNLQVADNGTGVSTTYSPDGTPQGQVIDIPSVIGDESSAPTGIVYNPTGDFIISSGTASGPALYLFATEQGTIAGWSPDVDPMNAVIVLDESDEEAVLRVLESLQDDRLRRFPPDRGSSKGSFPSPERHQRRPCGVTDTRYPIYCI